jgi:NAD(P)-dependent dehydrogenase (short-subunit alcohol dehydrogenase family)
VRRVVAVTAGTGDIGIEICRALVRADLEPLAIDLEAPETGAAKLSAAGVTSA